MTRRADMAFWRYRVLLAVLLTCIGYEVGQLLAPAPAACYSAHDHVAKWVWL